MFCGITMTPTAWVYFGISGEFDPHELSSQVGLAPEECLPKHSRNAGRGIPKTSILRYARMETFSPLIDIYELTDRAMDALDPYRDQFASMISKSRATACLQIVLHFSTSDDVPTPIFGFSNKAVSFVAFTGASIDIDTYRANP